MKKIFTAAFLYYFSFCAFGQPVLKPSIGLSAPPTDNDVICPAQVYTGSFASSGYNVGDTIPQFKLYSLTGQELDIANELNTGKPAVLIAGSYTCPVFRNKISSVNSLVATHGSLVNIFIIYTVEAHPYLDVSPYSGNVWTTSQNITENILYQQPVNYGARKAMVADMLGNLSINAPVFIDGPCNEWWNNFGPAPNNAYLIKPDGVVFAKHDWYNQPPHNVATEIDNLLNGTGGGGGPANGTFVFNYNPDSIVYDVPGTEVIVYATIVNNSSSDAEIDVIRVQNNLPGTWLSSMCTFICFDPTTDSTYSLLPPGDTIFFSMHFYTDGTPATGNTLIAFKNRNVPSNTVYQAFYGTTDSSVLSVQNLNSENNFYAYPNPAVNTLFINSEKPADYFIYSIDGKTIKNGHSQHKIDISELSPGIYFININNSTTFKFIKTAE